MSTPPIQLVITTSAYGGMFIGRYNGKTVFVPHTFPGEVVKVRIVDEKKNFSIGELVEVVKRSDKRVTAPCEYFGKCGGCHYQHLSYADQLVLKQEVFIDQLQRISKIKDPIVNQMIASPRQQNYRNNMQFHVNRSGRLCFVQSVEQEGLMEVSRCLIAQDEINKLLSELRFEDSANLERVSIRNGSDELMLVLESDEVEMPDVEIEADISVIHLTDDDAVVLAGNDHIFIEVLGKRFRVSAGSFFQVNTEMAAIMVEKVMSYLELDRSKIVMDLYCGVGLFTAFISEKAGKVIAIESAPSSCADLEQNLVESDNVELYEGLAEEVLPYLKEKVDIVVVDPPRAGLDKKVIDAINNLKPKSIVYVSCDPSTFARDVTRFESGGYRLVESTPIDMFPNTFHIESINHFIFSADQ